MTRKTDDPITIPGNLAKHFELGGARPAGKDLYRGLTIYLADGGPHYDAQLKDNLSPQDAWMKAGYYVATWAIVRGRKIIGRPLYFGLHHDPRQTPAAKLKLRLAAALEDAKRHIDDGYQAALYG